MTFMPTDRAAVLAEVASDGPRHLKQFTGCIDRDAYGRLAVVCAKLASLHVLAWTAPGTYDLGPEAPPWARRVRALRDELNGLRARQAEREPI